MANQLLSKQSENINENKYDSFSDVVKRHLEAKGKSQKDLTKLCALSKTTASRIIRNSNDKGSTYKPDYLVVMAVIVGLKSTREESKELFFAAFPEMAYLENFLDKKLTIYEANEVLDDNGLSLLGNFKEE